MPEPADHDLVQLQRIVLGRDIAGEAELADRRRRSLVSLLCEFVGSQEFLLNVQRPYIAGRLPASEVWRRPVGAAAGWAAVHLPLQEGARPGVAEARSWTELHARLFSDPAFQQEIEAYNPSAARGPLADTVARMAGAMNGRALAGGLQDVSAREVLGWALDVNDLTAPVQLELVVDGEPAARGVTELFRRDLQDEVGGSGRYGFVLRWDAPTSGRELLVREVGSQVTLAATAIEAAESTASLATFERDLRGLREVLDRLEARASALRGLAVTPLSGYAEWSRAYVEPTPAGRLEREERQARFVRRPVFDLIIEASADRRRTAFVLERLAEQSWPEWSARIAVPSDGREALTAMVGQLPAPTRARVTLAHGADEEADFRSGLEEAQGTHVILLDAGVALGPDALGLYAGALQQDPEPLLVYADDDVYDAQHPRAARIRPRLRGAFDPDLLLQEDAAGPVLCVERRALRMACARGADLASSSRHELVLRVMEEAGEDAIRHVPGVGAHLPAPQAGDGDRVLSAVRAHQVRAGVRAEVQLLTDDFGAPASGAVRVVHPLPAGVTATVIIPTKDRVDLLAPCLNSLETRRRQNLTGMQVLVVDNGSVEPESKAFFDRLTAQGAARVLQFGGPFNFAAINNFAARTSTADVIVMLNNDVEAVTADWLDALVRHAVRPEIGAVGARLLYEDLTIQHAGVVTGGVDELAAHDGVGSPAADGGYLARHARTRRVTAVTGACLATRREVWEALGGLDAAHFAVDGNDVDYCLRAQQHGLAVIYTPDCTILHHESKSRGFNARSEQSRRRGEAEAALLRSRWGPRLAHDPFYNPAFDRGSRPFTRLGPPDGA